MRPARMLIFLIFKINLLALTISGLLYRRATYLKASTPKQISMQRRLLLFHILWGESKFLTSAKYIHALTSARQIPYFRRSTRLILTMHMSRKWTCVIMLRLGGPYYLMIRDEDPHATSFAPSDFFFPQGPDSILKVLSLLSLDLTSCLPLL